MHKAFVLLHPEDGIYCGNAMGFGFWSKMDAAGQNRVPIFETEDQAREHVRSWDANNDDTQYRYVPVATEDSYYATIEELRTAGLDEHLGDLLSPVPSV